MEEEVDTKVEGRDEEEEEEEKDEKGCWLVMAICIVTNILIGGTMTSFGITMKFMEDYFEVDVALVALVGSVYNGSTLIFGPLAAGLVKILGMRLVFFLGGFLMALGFLMAYFAKSIVLLIIFYGLVSGIGCSLVVIIAATACNYFFKKNKAMAAGLAKCGVPIGSAIFPMIITTILKSYNWHGVVVLFSCMWITISVIGFFIPPIPIIKSVESE